MEFRTRKMIMPAHLNGAHNLFGGQALAWIDEEAAVYASCQLHSPKVVTKFISSINFQSPAVVGDLIEIGCDLVSFGRTSITISCVIRNKTTKKEVVSVDKIVMVLLGKDGLPMEHGITELTPFDD